MLNFFDKDLIVMDGPLAQIKEPQNYTVLSNPTRGRVHFTVSQTEEKTEETGP